MITRFNYMMQSLNRHISYLHSMARMCRVTMITGGQGTLVIKGRLRNIRRNRIWNMNAMLGITICAADFSVRSNGR